MKFIYKRKEKNNVVEISILANKITEFRGYSKRRELIEMNTDKKVNIVK